MYMRYLLASICIAVLSCNNGNGNIPYNSSNVNTSEMNILNGDSSGPCLGYRCQ